MQCTRRAAGLQQARRIELGEVRGRQHVGGMQVEPRDAIAQTGEHLVANRVGGARPVVGGRLAVLLTATGSEQLHGVALMDAKLGGRPVQVDDELVHAQSRMAGS